MGTPLSTKASSRWSKSKTAKKIMSMKECTSIVDGLKIIYFTKVSDAKLLFCSSAHIHEEMPILGHCELRYSIPHRLAGI